MSDIDSVKEQRDRFLAFAFASADLFMESDTSGKVIYALGAAKGMTGVDHETLKGKHWLDIFSEDDQKILERTHGSAKDAVRVGPLICSLHPDIHPDKKAIVTGIKMPGSKHFYITLGLSNVIMSKLGEAMKRSQSDKLLNKEMFIESAADTIKATKEAGQDAHLTMLELAIDPEDEDRFGEDGIKKLQELMSNALLSYSIDGQAAAMISDNQYSVMHDADMEPSKIQEEIVKLTEEADPEGKGLDVKKKTVTSDLANINERDAARALVYTINDFERKGTELTIESLNSGLETYISENAQRIRELQETIERLSFKLFFQPIVNLETLEVSHYEMLSRFDYGETQEWIMFCEDVGLAADFDLAVCERAINYVRFKAGTTNTKFSVNLSGQSIEDENFFNSLMQKLKGEDNLSERLTFEITESAHIKDLDLVNNFIRKLQDEGYKIALDDFGAGAASFQYLQTLDVDIVKIDGKYIRKIQNSQRDAAMVKNLTQMCIDLDIQVVAEFVEDQAQIDFLKEIGVQYGQGYFFGKPEANPSYKNP